MSQKFYSENFRNPVENLLKDIELRGTARVAGGPQVTKGIDQYQSAKQIARDAKQQSDTIAGLMNKTGGPLNVGSQIDFSESNVHSYSGTDVTAAIVFNEHILLLNNVETFAYSIHREKVPVRRLGDVNAKNYTYGSRTIAGSIVFVAFDEHPLYGLFQFLNDRTAKTTRYSSPLSDDIPPFDIILYFSNESGAGSIMRFYGIEISDEGGVFSINDIYSENTMQWTAKDMDPMISEGKQGSWKQLLFRKQLEGKVVDEQYAAMLRYRQRLENDVSRISREIQVIDKEIQELELRTRSAANDPTLARYNIETTPDPALPQRRNALTKQANLKQEKIDRLIAEIAKVDASIRSYESSNMTWDMDTNLYGTTKSQVMIKPYQVTGASDSPGYEPYGNYSNTSSKPHTDSLLNNKTTGINKSIYPQRPYVDQKRPPPKGNL